MPSLIMLQEPSSLATTLHKLLILPHSSHRKQLLILYFRAKGAESEGLHVVVLESQTTKGKRKTLVLLTLKCINQFGYRAGNLSQQNPVWG